MPQLKPHISLLDKSYNTSKSSVYKLYVEISNNGLKHTVFNTENNTFIGLEEYRFSDISNDYSLVAPLKDIITNNSIYKNEFSSIFISVVNNRSTLIPNAIFKADKLESFHQFNFSKKEEDQFYSDQLINLSGYNVYSIPDFITDIFKGLNHVKFIHFSSSLIESSLISAKNNQALSLVHVHVLPSSFQVVVVINQKLELYNSFGYQSSEDFIYYLLFVLDQLNIKTEEASISLSGEIEKTATIYSVLNKYLKTLNFNSRPDNLNFSHVLEEIPNHFHYSLFNQYLCE